MNDRSSFEEVIDQTGTLVYTSVGSSMLPLIRSGKDILIIKKPEGPLRKYDIPLYKRDNGQYILHRIVKVKKEDYVLCGDNQSRKEYGITDRHIIGVLKEIVRDGKKLSVDCLQCRIYAHLWCDLFFFRPALLRLMRILRVLRMRLTEGEKV